jgi:hypothetical protein
LFVELHLELRAQGLPLRVHGGNVRLAGMEVVAEAATQVPAEDALYGNCRHVAHGLRGGGDAALDDEARPSAAQVAAVHSLYLAGVEAAEQRSWTSLHFSG